eukprot:scaffold110392_cov56-Attheya_sp.AAC.2
MILTLTIAYVVMVKAGATEVRLWCICVIVKSNDNGSLAVDMVSHVTGNQSFSNISVLAREPNSPQNSYGLTEVVVGKTRLIRCAQATDGFQTSKRQTCVMGGVKMQDYSGICPLTRNQRNDDVSCTNGDMSRTWKLFDKGGAFKVSHLPCWHSTINVVIHGIHGAVYHHDMLCPEKVEEMQEEMLKLSEVLTVSLEELN